MNPNLKIIVRVILLPVIYIKLNREIIAFNIPKMYYFQVVFTHAILSYRQMILSIEVPVKHIFAYHLKTFGKGSYPLAGNPDSFF